ncbi:hypothetical protein [Mesorhizobium sp. M0189]
MTEETARALMFDALIVAVCISTVMAGFAIGIALIRAAWNGELK